MYNDRQVIAIVLAGGKGQRFGKDIPKQFYELNGHPIIYYSLNVFNSNHFIDEIIVVSNKEYLEATRSICNIFHKVSDVIIGGETRSLSSMNGVMSVRNPNSYVLIHDSARPFVTNELIKQLLSNVEETGAVIPVLRSVDTLVEVGSDGYVANTLDRNSVFRVQTPQCFKYEVILEAYRRYLGKFVDLPDDSSLVIKEGISRVKTIEGDARNIKITTQEDILISINLSSFCSF